MKVGITIPAPVIEFTEELPYNLIGSSYIDPYRRKNKKVGRNEKCHCKSGKKYKKCCLNK